MVINSAVVTVLTYYLQRPYSLVVDDILDLSKTCGETELFHPEYETVEKHYIVQ